MVRGIDISNQNHINVDFRKVKASGRDFVICKSNEGDWKDPTFTKARIAAARAADLIVGSYVYLRPKAGRDGREEAKWYIASGRLAGLWRADKGAQLDVRPVLDIETSNFGTDDAGVKATEHYIKEAVREILDELGRHPIIYTGNFWRGYLRQWTDASDCPLWYPEYNTRHAWTATLIPHAWRKPTIFQDSSTTRVPGVYGDCDADLYAGSLTQFKAECCI